MGWDSEGSESKCCTSHGFEYNRVDGWQHEPVAYRLQIGGNAKPFGQGFPAKEVCRKYTVVFEILQAEEWG